MAKLLKRRIKMGQIIFYYILPRPQWERAGMRVKLGCLLFISGSCFGQKEQRRSDAT